jgi:NADH-quinone oxidoreductase subunit K
MLPFIQYSYKSYVALGAILFCFGLAGVCVRRNMLVVFMCVELMLNAANLTFLAFARQMGSLSGHAIAFFVMAVAAAEAAVGLAIVIAVFRTRGTLNVDEVTLLKN